MRSDRLNVTAADIAKANSLLRDDDGFHIRSKCCPVAQCLLRKHPGITRITVGRESAVLHYGDVRFDSFPFSKRLQRFIADYDFHGTAEPASFVIRWEEPTSPCD